MSSQGDLTWDGPFFVDRGAWWPTRFILYQEELYCCAQIGWSSPMLVWNRTQRSVTFGGHMSFDTHWSNDAEVWARMLTQVEAKLANAVRNIEAYNARVKRYLPDRCRVGRIRRRYTWPKHARAPLSLAAAQQLRRGLEAARRWPSLKALSLSEYLATAAVAYDAAFADLRGLSPREKYVRRADGRHGGMLELAPDDASAFDAWFGSRAWLGGHPWEIVFAHPHGILLSPERGPHGWRFHLGVDTLGLYLAAARMVGALLAKKVPVELVDQDEVLAALRGEDWVEVGPFCEQLPLQEIEQRRPGASMNIEWDPFPTLELRAAAAAGATS